MASVIFYMTLLLCAVALSEGCSCAIPTIPPTAGWKGNVFGYWNMQRFCDADFGEIIFQNVKFKSTLLTWSAWQYSILLFNEEEHGP